MKNVFGWLKWKAKSGWRRMRQYRPGIQRQCTSAFHGSEYGGWTICPDYLSEQSIVYSFGVGEDATFDRAIMEVYGCAVFAFDPTPKSINWVKGQDWPAQFSFYEYGIADYDGTIRFFPPENPDHVSHTVLYRESTTGDMIEVPVKRLKTIMQELGHSHIDILKMDIEGSEYAVLEDVMQSGIKIGQVLIEFHHRFASVPVKQTKDAVKLLNKHGFDLFCVSASVEEFSFIHSSMTS